MRLRRIAEFLVAHAKNVIPKEVAQALSPLSDPQTESEESNPTQLRDGMGGRPRRSPLPERHLDRPSVNPSEPVSRYGQALPFSPGPGGVHAPQDPQLILAMLQGARLAGGDV